ncbi:MAG: hypothetical protein IT385_03845 [Deltaproteobacteria bacterium]|nr:hypothetical protein [Deltaproteobacteria bacterium]
MDPRDEGTAAPDGAGGEAGLKPSEIAARLPEYEARLEAARTSGDRAAEAEAHEWLAGMRVATGEVDAGLVHAADAVALRRAPGGDAGPLARALVWQARLARGAARAKEAEAAADEAARIAREAGADALVVEADLELAALHEAQARLPEALEALRDARARLPALGAIGELPEHDARRGAWPQVWRGLATVQQGLGAFGPAVDAFIEVEAWCEQAGDKTGAMMARFAQAPLREWNGQIKDALALWGRVIVDARALGAPVVEGQCYAALATFAAREKMTEKAVEWATWARTLALQNVDPVTYLHATSVLVDVYDRQGLRVRAVELLVAARDLLESSMGREPADQLLRPVEAGLKKRWGAATFDALVASRTKKPDRS